MIDVSVHVDYSEVEQKLEGTRLRMKKTIRYLELACNREVIKLAKSNYKAQGHKNTPATYNGRTMPTVMRSFHTAIFGGGGKKIKDSGTFVSVGPTKKQRDYAFQAQWIEKGAHIVPKHKGGRLLFKIDGEWRSSDAVDIQATPFMTPAFEAIWKSGKSKIIMDKQIDKRLKKYWEKQGK